MLNEAAPVRIRDRDLLKMASAITQATRSEYDCIVIKQIEGGAEACIYPAFNN
jgi:hypothetical protein